jgi:uncharacterized protein
MDTNTNFIGRGWSFPPEFDKKNRQVAMTTGREDIERSLEILLGTIRGERVMRPDYGSNLDEMVFEAFDQSMKTYLAQSLETAILYHEPRIEPLRIELDDSEIHEGKILIEIEYKIRSTNSRFNMVYPFYIDEATEL